MITVKSSYSLRVVGRNGLSNSTQHLTITLKPRPNDRCRIPLAWMKPGNVVLAVNLRL